MEICLFYTESLTNPSRARDVFAEMRRMGAHSVMFNIYEQDLLRWARDLPRVVTLARREGLRCYVSPARHGGVFSGLMVVPSLYSYVHPESLVVGAERSHDGGEAQPPMQGFFRRITCVNDPDFRQYIRRQFQSIFEALDPDGLLLDEPKGLTMACSCPRCVAARRAGESPVDANIRLQLEFITELCDLCKSRRADMRTMLAVTDEHEELLRRLGTVASLDVLGASAYWAQRGRTIEWLRAWCPQTVEKIRATGKQVQIWAGNWGLSAAEMENLPTAYRSIIDSRPDQLCSFWYWRNSDDPQRVMELTARCLQTIGTSA